MFIKISTNGETADMVLTNNKGKLPAEYKPEVKVHLETLRGPVWPNGSVSASITMNHKTRGVIISWICLDNFYMRSVI
jgi:hypothetical protein